MKYKREGSHISYSANMAAIIFYLILVWVTPVEFQWSWLGVAFLVDLIF